MRRDAALRAARIACAAVFYATLGATLVACGDRERELRPVPVPDTATFETAVRARLASARAELDRVVASRPDDAALGEAYGSLAMTYHAQAVYDPAAVAYANAHALAPRDKRWPYLLGQLQAHQARMPEAIAAFEAALAIDPGDPVLQIVLGRAYLKQGTPEKASPLFEKAKSSAAGRAAALAGLGNASLAQRRYRDAIDAFEEALKLAPAASRLRQPLAVAYRGVGDTAKAEASLKAYAPEGLEPGIPDPMLEAMNGRAAAYRAVLARARYATQAGRPDLAEQILRQAVSDDPKNAEAVANLGITLANLGRVDEARQWLTQAIALDDTNAMVHFSLGMVLDRQGHDQAAIDEYAAASRRDPDHVQALVYRADAEMRIGDADAAAQLYRDALAKSPGNTRIESSLAMALVKAGRLAEARGVLEQAAKAQPDNPDVANALARILSTASKDAVRDGPVALRIAKGLYESTDRNPIAAQTYAMALAETGDYRAAVRIQREALSALDAQGGAATRDSFAARNLELYERRRPAREGWPRDDPMFKPRSPAARLVAKNG